MHFYGEVRVLELLLLSKNKDTTGKIVSPTPRRSTCPRTFDGRRNNAYLRPIAATSSHAPTAQAPERHTSHLQPAGRTETPDLRTPQAGDRLDATGQVLHVGDEVSFHATSYTAGGTGTVKRSQQPSLSSDGATVAISVVPQAT